MQVLMYRFVKAQRTRLQLLQKAMQAAFYGPAAVQVLSVTPIH